MTRDELEEELNARAAASNLWSDGGYNTVIPYNDIAHDGAHSDRIWRISKGTDEDKRKKHLDDWRVEAALTEQAGLDDIGPYVYDMISSGSKLTEKYFRVALLVSKYTEDLHSALFKEWKSKKVKR